MSRLYLVICASKTAFMKDTALYQDKYRIAGTRLPGYDYGQSGAYFITICTQGRQPYFGNIAVPNGDWAGACLQPTELGEVAAECWTTIPELADFVRLDTFVLMPDHLHGVLLFDKQEADKLVPLSYENRFGPQSRNLASVLRGFKSAVTTHARKHWLDFQWQTRFHDRIVRSDQELEKIRTYILTNPSRWEAEYDNGEGLYR